MLLLYFVTSSDAQESIHVNFIQSTQKASRNTLSAELKNIKHIIDIIISNMDLQEMN